MDVEKWKGALQKLFSKERGMKGLIFLGICGIALIYLSTLLGSGKEKQSAAESETAACTAAEYEKNLEREIVRIVGAITGETDPAVMVTLKSGSRYVYAMEEKGASRQEAEGESSAERETAYVILKNAEGAQQALPVTEIQPKIKGVVIVSRYAGDPEIREKLTEAVKTALDISSARICVTGSG